MAIMKELDFSEDSRIDHNNLDVECVNDAFKYGQYVRSMVDAEDAYDRAKDNLKVIIAEMDNKIRKEVLTSGEKVTETIVSNKVLLSKEYKIAAEEMLQAKHTYSILKGGVETLDKRSDRLESLIRLEARQYFAGPTVPRNLDSEMSRRIITHKIEAERKEVDERVKGRINRKRGD